MPALGVFAGQLSDDGHGCVSASMKGALLFGGIGAGPGVMMTFKPQYAGAAGIESRRIFKPRPSP